MANRNDQERAKFVLDGSGNVCVAGAYAMYSADTASPRDELEAGKFNVSGQVRIVSS